ncbi:hypothetical protein Tsubulata_030397 [Turnera subulata]|uniref:VQ domain-containing protein n=1 Tax=Turnera subulata TaxID=218843 RepID=A0A9Q0JRS2_9ROSI|nr:hypothetical protein Tsubulata_030397 [Turnera subulata]
MGKKIHKICKNEKQQFNDLIQVLRPKVFITDSSNFKRLVQELTGNESSTPSPQLAGRPRNDQEPPVPIIGIDDQQDRLPQGGMETPVDGFVDSLELCNQLFLAEEMNQVHNSGYTGDHAALDALNSNSTMEEGNMSAYRDFESWLLDGDESFSFFNGYALTGQQVRF